MTDQDFAEDLVLLLNRGLIALVDWTTSDDEQPRFEPTPAGRAAIAAGDDEDGALFRTTGVTREQ